MRCNRFAAVLIGLAAVALLAADASAMYHPALGRFLQRDPIGYADGMGLYEYVRSVPSQRVDPRGLASGGIGPGGDAGEAGDVCYCCCVEEVAIGNGQREEVLLGHRFTVTVRYNYVRTDKALSDRHCKLYWREKSNRVPASLKPLGAADNQWNDLHALYPASPTFGGWSNRYKGGGVGGAGEARLPDQAWASEEEPRRVTYFAIRVDSAKGCPCTILSVESFATQTLEPAGEDHAETEEFELGVREEELRDLPGYSPIGGDSPP